MKKFVRYGIFVIASLLILILILSAYTYIALPNVGKPEKLKVELTPFKVERGKYLAYHVMMCADCHSQRDFSKFSGPPKPGTEFVGGDIFDHSMGFPGRFVSSNITAYGIGDWTDGELFRLITTGVNKDGSPIFPVMPYHIFGKVAREDVEAVMAYLRTLVAVESNHHNSKADFPFNFILRTMPKKANLTEKPSRLNRAEYGEYMFTAAACADCHTNFDKGKFVGPLAGGGREFLFPDGSIGRAPNLTPHETGIKNFTSEAFVQLFKKYADSSYVAHDVATGDFQTLMPWVMYSGMEEEDLEAIYEYLQTLPAYDNPVVRFSSAN